MAETSTEAPKARQKVTKMASPSAETASDTERNGYVVPIIGVHVPGVVVNVGFWGGLAGAALMGIVDPPLAALIGAGVVIGRHGSKSK